jgi:hypothetical protein
VARRWKYEEKEGKEEIWWRMNIWKKLFLMNLKVFYANVTLTLDINAYSCYHLAIRPLCGKLTPHIHSTFQECIYCRNDCKACISHQRRILAHLQLSIWWSLNSLFKLWPLFCLPLMYPISSVFPVHLLVLWMLIYCWKVE